MTAGRSVLRVASAGLGHGSTGLIIGMVLGLDGLPRLDACAFADTGDEQLETYAHAARFREWLQERGILLLTKRKEDPSGSLSQSIFDRLAGKRPSASPIPLHLADPDGRALQGCTRDWKMRPLDKHYKALSKLRGGQPVEVCIGYTVEEFHRVPAPAKYGWPDHFSPRYPLIEAGWNRGKCVEIIREHLSWPVVSSCCIMCPHRPTVGPGSFAELLERSPETFARVEALDDAIRDGKAWGLEREGYLSAMRLPLRKAIEVAQRQGVFDFSQGDGSCDGGTCWT